MARSKSRATTGTIQLGGSKQRVLLALLLLHANEVVPAAALIELLWTEAPPADAAKALQVHVSRLRRALDPTTCCRRSRAATCSKSTPQTSTSRASRSCAAAGRELLAAGRRGRRAASARRGARALARDAARRLRSRILRPAARRPGSRSSTCDATEDRIDADLLLGAHAQLVGRARGARRAASAPRAAARAADARAVPLRPAGRRARRPTATRGGRSSTSSESSPAGSCRSSSSRSCARTRRSTCAARGCTRRGPGGGPPALRRARTRARRAFGRARGRRRRAAGGSSSSAARAASARRASPTSSPAARRTPARACSGDAARSAPERRRTGRGRRRCKSLGEDVPELDAEARRRGERFRLFVDLAAHLSRRRAGSRLLLVLDDLHHGDDLSLLLLEFVAGELAEMHVAHRRDLRREPRRAARARRLADHSAHHRLRLHRSASRTSRASSS